MPYLPRLRNDSDIREYLDSLTRSLEDELVQIRSDDYGSKIFDWVLLRSPDGSVYTLSVSDSGVLQVTRGLRR